jgi:hypothetical protein
VTLISIFDAIADEPSTEVIQMAVHRVDELLTHFSLKERLELAGAWVLIEQSAGGFLRRFSTLSRDERLSSLRLWSDAGGLRREIVQGMKELMALAFYSGESRWDEIHYAGPMVRAVPDRGTRERETLLQSDETLGRYWGKTE